MANFNYPWDEETEKTVSVIIDRSEYQKKGAETINEMIIETNEEIKDPQLVLIEGLIAGRALKKMEEKLFGKEETT